MARYCVEQQFKNEHVRGYRTLGNIQLSYRQLRSVIRQASDAVDVPEMIVREIITLSSGFRPGAIANNGRIRTYATQAKYRETIWREQPS